MKTLSSSIFFAFLFLTSCKVINQKSNSLTIISGNANKTKISITDIFSYKNYFRFYDTLFTQTTRFTKYSNLFINDTYFKLYQSDTIFIEQNNTDSFFRNTNKLNREYNKFFKDFQKETKKQANTNWNYLYDRHDSIIENENFISSYYSKQKSFTENVLKNLFLKYTFNDSLQKKLSNYILNTQVILNSYRDFINCKTELEKKNNLKPRLLNYINYINKLELNEFSVNDIHDLIEDIVFIQMPSTFTKKDIQNEAQVLIYYNNLKKNYKQGSLFYDYLITSVYMNTIHKNIKIKNKFLKSFRKDVKNSQFKNYFNPIIYTENNGIEDSEFEKCFYTFNNSSVSLEDLTLKYKEKPLLIDFWATWCAPCLKQMPETIKLKKLFEKLNIIFISTDKSKDKWREFLSESEINNFENFKRNTKNQDTIFLKFQEIPKYGFLQKDGTIKLLNEINEDIIKNYCDMFL